MIEELVNVLKQNGLKVTPQRLAVLRLLSKGGHYSGEQIYEILKKEEPSISLSTVYNTLETLKKAGIINSFELNGVTWYEMRKVPHVNVYCIDTEEIIDVDVELNEIYNEIRKKGIEVKSMNIVAYAECSSMRKDIQKSAP
ncbi:MAG: Fur family transcriptional regulator [Sulfolobaceae archaeon]